jgi:phosphonopyruvate decarboxylase
MASRELYELREARREGHQRDFLTVGGMGHASQIALGIAKARPDVPVVCLDGDGAFLMHMGSTAYTAHQANLIHVVLNNGCHDSVGGQETLAATLNLSEIAMACGFERVNRPTSEREIEMVMSSAIQSHGKNRFVEIVCCAGHRDNLGRPKTSPKENKQQLLGFLAAIGVTDAAGQGESTAS